MTGGEDAVAHEQSPPPPAAPPIPPVLDEHDPAWLDIDPAAAGAIRGRLRDLVIRVEGLLDAPDVQWLFDESRSSRSDRAIAVREVPEEPLWFIGDLHGDLLALECALSLVDRLQQEEGTRQPRIVLLGDIFDDGGYGLETALRVLELLVTRPSAVCVIAGNHEDALGYDGGRFTATVSPSDFADDLNANAAHEWIGRVGKLMVRLAARAPRALFFPDGLLVAHGGFPLVDLHEELAASGDWNDARCLSDFTWTRAHPRARRKLPNRMSRGSQFGYEDFAAFCRLASALGRPVTHMVRGHDHVDERFEIPPAYAATPILTTVALSRRLDREAFGSFVRVPTVARYVAGALPQVHRLHIDEAHVRAWYPEQVLTDASPEARL